MSESILRNKAQRFAVDIVYLCRDLKRRGAEGALYSQMLRSGTSIGANVYEAQYAQGSKDFISKFEIALKECNETAYWLEILRDTKCLTTEEFSVYFGRCTEIRRLLIASVTTMKNKY